MNWNKEQNIRDASCWLANKIELIETKHDHKVKGINPQMLRGGIFNVDLGSGNIGGEKNKIRPCLVLSNNTLNKGDTIIVVPLTTKFKCKMNNNKKIPMYKNHYILLKSKYNFLREDSCIKFEDTRSVDKVRVMNFIGNIDISDLALLKNRLLFTMGF